jgi:hypothetical protein
MKPSPSGLRLDFNRSPLEPLLVFKAEDAV